MPVIVFANPKGGAGKSTSAVVLTQLALKGAAVTIIDPPRINRPVTQWASQGGYLEKHYGHC